MINSFEYIEEFEPPIFQLDWMLVYRCNYDCSYCDSHDLTSDIPSIDYKEFDDIFDYVKSIIPKSTLFITFLGGEPFLYKDLHKIFTDKHSDIRFNIQTNLSAPIKILQRIPKNVRITSTFHPEFSNPDEYLNKIDTLEAAGVDVLNLVAIHSDKKLFDISKYVLENNTAKRTKAILLNVKTSNDTWNKVMDYSDEQLQFVRKHFNNHKSNKKQYVINGTQYFSEMSELRADGLLNFKGLQCEVGKNRLHIKSDGSVFPAACLLNYNASIGNIFKKDLQLPNKAITCPFTYCGCASDLYMKKYRKEV